MIDAFSNKDSLHVSLINQLIDSFRIGGLIFFQGGPVRQALLSNQYQQRSRHPLFIGIDGEWGLQMRLDSTIRFPRQMTLSAGSSKEQVYAMGREIGRQCRRMGIHINFAPDIDINNNPGNPIINSRSFGEDKFKVAEYGMAYMKGLQDEKVLACAKHFPGHGDTDSDSHHVLPLVNASKERLDSLELYPFKQLIENGLASVMVAHLSVPALDTTPGRAATLSPRIVNDLLKGNLGFEGLVFTDALNMKGVADYYPSGDLELKALLAGNDILLYSLNIPVAFERIHYAIQNCEIDQELIDGKVKRILAAKYWAGLNGSDLVSANNLIQDLNSDFANYLNMSLYANAPTLLKNAHGRVPLSPYYRDCIASIVLNDTAGNAFQKQLSCYANVDAFHLSKDATEENINSVLNQLEAYDRVIVSVHNTSINAARNFGLSPQMLTMLEKAGDLKGSVICVFGNPYILGKIPSLEKYDVILQAYEDTWWPQLQVAQKIFGAMECKGVLPVSVPPDFKIGDGLFREQVNKLRFTLPEEVGLKSAAFHEIDSMLSEAILDSVMPGCQVLMAIDGKVIYNKAFGYHDYQKSHPVKSDDVYDIASVTKMVSTAIAVMYLHDKRKIDLDAPAAKYLKQLRHSDKKHITLRQLMAHNSGLKSWIPFWKETMDSSGLSPAYYRKVPEKLYTLQVADSLYLLDNYPDQMLQEIIDSPLENQGNYVYSDLGIILLQKIVEQVSGKSIDHFVNDILYKPIGLHETGYKPLEWISRDRIVPTEMDTTFRNQLVHGFVHDPAAAMMGGVGGHAGVFSSAQSLAVIMQMLLNNGEYGGKRFLKKETVRKFTSKAYPESNNRRGLIFDKPDPALGENGPAARSASELAFGHSGFTGTCAWADPESKLIYIFLSNRVHPSAANNKLSKSNLRTRIMQVAYNALRIR